MHGPGLRITYLLDAHHGRQPLPAGGMEQRRGDLQRPALTVVQALHQDQAMLGQDRGGGVDQGGNVCIGVLLASLAAEAFAVARDRWEFEACGTQGFQEVGTLTGQVHERTSPSTRVRMAMTARSSANAAGRSKRR